MSELNKLLRKCFVASCAIYRAIKIVITDMFNSAKDVIQMDDEESHTMIVKGFSKVPTIIGLAGTKNEADVWYTIRLQARDNRYRVDIYQIKGYTPVSVINGVAYGPYDWPAEMLTYDKAFKANGRMKIAREGFFRRAVIDGCNSLLEKIEQKVKENIMGDTLPINENW